jgi:hypothetical protein
MMVIDRRPGYVEREGQARTRVARGGPELRAGISQGQDPSPHVAFQDRDGSWAAVFAPTPSVPDAEALATDPPERVQDLILAGCSVALVRRGQRRYPVTDGQQGCQPAAARTRCNRHRPKPVPVTGCSGEWVCGRHYKAPADHRTILRICDVPPARVEPSTI